ncbi:hypothetical protein T10_4328, partial [Trichinella papuae]
LLMERMKMFLKRTDSLPDTDAIFPDSILSYASETEHATTYSDSVAVIDPSAATAAIEALSKYATDRSISFAIASGLVCMLNGHSDVLMDDADHPAPSIDKYNSTHDSLSGVELLQEKEIDQNLNDLFTFLFPSSPTRKNVMYQYNTSEFDSDLDKYYEDFVKKSSVLKATAAEDWKKQKVKDFMLTLIKDEVENLRPRSKIANLASTSLTPMETDSADMRTNDADGSAVNLDISSISLLDIFSFEDSDDSEDYNSIRSLRISRGVLRTFFFLISKLIF